MAWIEHKLLYHTRNLGSIKERKQEKSVERIESESVFFSLNVSVNGTGIYTLRCSCNCTEQLQLTLTDSQQKANIA